MFSYIPMTVFKAVLWHDQVEETLTGQPHDTTVQKATSDNANVDAV